MSETQRIRFLVDPPEPRIASKNALPGMLAASSPAKVVEITAETVANQLKGTLAAFGDALDQLPDVGTFRVSEVKLSLAFDASGELSIVSVAKGHIGGKTEIQVTLDRRP